jgi:predicted glycosyltransferase
MKIWIDYINTPQVTFWIPFIKGFKAAGHEIMLTCRDSGNTVELLKQHDLNFHVVGQTAGKGMFRKSLLFPKRLTDLYLFIKNKHIDIAVSQSSFYQPLITRMLGIPCLYTNDNEHAKGNIFAFLFAKKVVLPLVLQNKKFTRKWPLKSKLSFYPGIKEAIYLSQMPELLPPIDTPKHKVYFRPEPCSAQYYKGPLNFFDDTLIKLAKDYDITVLPRDKDQKEHYKQPRFNKLFTVAEKPLSLKEIVTNCQLFIGAGGSMTRELAVLGIPVISIYQEDSLCVDKYLLEKGCMKEESNLSYESIRSDILSDFQKNRDLNILEDGKISFKWLYNQIIKLK